MAGRSIKERAVILRYSRQRWNAMCVAERDLMMDTVDDVVERVTVDANGVVELVAELL